MTKPQHNHPPDPDDPDRIRPAADPLRPGRWRCPCGATAAPGRRTCRKCRDCAVFTRRATGRRRPTDTRPPLPHRPAMSVDPRGDHHQ